MTEIAVLSTLARSAVFSTGSIARVRSLHQSDCENDMNGIAVIVLRFYLDVTPFPFMSQGPADIAK